MARVRREVNIIEGERGGYVYIINIRFLIKL